MGSDGEKQSSVRLHSQGTDLDILAADPKEMGSHCFIQYILQARDRERE